ncbi:MAG: hypothetical protein ACE5GX_01530 [Thermoanaerobaculia bacterium]
MAKRTVLSSIVACLVLVLAMAAIAQAKAHVPLNRAQICTTDGMAKNVTTRNLQRRIGEGACRLTACVFNDVDNNDNVVQQFIFLPGDDCDPTDDNGDGWCDATGAPGDIKKRLKAVNVTPACTFPF